MTTPLFIIGAGGFGREVFSIVAAASSAHGNVYDVAFVDDHPSAADGARIGVLGSRLAGNVDYLASRREPFAAVIAIGSNQARKIIASRLSGAPVIYPVLVHPDATVGQDVQLSAGVVIAAGARLSTGIHVGSHVHVDQNAAVGHDVILGDFSRLNPQTCISGNVSVGEGVLVGAAATILQGLAVGVDAVIGAGAVVTRDVAPGAIVKGVPAR